MTATNLLLTIFFDESKADGRSAFRSLIARSSNCVLTLYAEGNKQPSSPTAFSAADRFNIAESLMKYDSRELRARYRPSVTSSFWAAPLSRASDLDALDKQSHELFQLFLTLSKLSRPGVSEQARNRGAVELLWCDVTASDRLEDTISSVLNSLCAGLLRSGTWGYADPVPFRGLTLNEEWAVALTSLLWIEPPTAAEGNHQYSFLCSVEGRSKERGADDLKVEVRRVV